MSHLDKPECSDARMTEALWKPIWEMRVPNKIKHFFWKLSHSWLPTNNTLFCRKVSQSKVCSICLEDVEEDGAHAIWKCSKSKFYWKKTIFLEKLKLINERDPCLFIKAVRENFDSADFALFAVVFGTAGIRPLEVRECLMLIV